MKTKSTKSQGMIEISESALLSLVSAKLRGRVLFPRRVEDAKKLLKQIKNCEFPTK